MDNVKLRMKCSDSKVRILFLLAFVECLLASFVVSILYTNSFAATYFVDYENGNDTNAGTSVQAPFQHCPGDSRATNNAKRTLGAGDTVVFKGGVTYSFTSGSGLYANASGTARNVITYQSGDGYSPAYGNRRAIIDGRNADHTYNTGTHVNAVFNLKTFSHLKVQGLEIKNLAASSSAEGLIGWFGDSGGDVTLDNLYLHDASNMGNGVMIQGLWDSGSNPFGFTISNCTIQTIDQHGIWTRVGVDGVSIRGNTISGVGTASTGGDCLFIGGADYDSSYPVPTTYEVVGNDLSDSATKSTIILGVLNGITIEKNSMHGNVAVAAIDIAGVPSNLIIRNNVINVNISKFGGFLRFFPDDLPVTTRNNIRVYNNTIVGKNAAYGSIVFFHGIESITPAWTNVDIRNNIIDTSDSNADVLVYIDTGADGSNPTVQMSTFTCDYNTYSYGTSSTPFFAWTYGYVTFASWKLWTSGNTGNDQHSLTGGVEYISRATSDYHLSGSDTKAAGKGVNLYMIFTDDKDAESRQATGAWDIGAYEYVPGGDTTAPAPPTGLAVH